MIGIGGKIGTVPIFLFAVAAPVQAASIGGQLSYPSEGLPAMMVVARNSAGATFSTQTKIGQARYRIEVPEGRYVVFAIALGTGDPAGKEPRGAHTSYSICARDKTRRCATGPLEELELGPDARREDADIDDWYLPDALAATLKLEDVFGKYPADMNPPASTRPPDFETAPAAVKAQRARIQRATTRGPYYAGRVAIARWECGARCEHWVLVDLASGRITWPEDAALQPVRSDFPCEAQALEYREESRLLRVHRREGGQVVTRDFLWSYEAQRLEPVGSSAQSVERFCR